MLYRPGTSAFQTFLWITFACVLSTLTYMLRCMYNSTFFFHLLILNLLFTLISFSALQFQKLCMHVGWACARIKWGIFYGIKNTSPLCNKSVPHWKIYPHSFSWKKVSECWWRSEQFLVANVCLASSVCEWVCVYKCVCVSEFDLCAKGPTGACLPCVWATGSRRATNIVNEQTGLLLSTWSLGSTHSKGRNQFVV